MQSVLPARWRRDPSPLQIAPEPRSEPTSASRPDPWSELRPVPPGAVTIDGIDLGSLASIAVRCGVTVFAIAGLGVAALWLLASSAGVVARTESFMQSIGFRDFSISTTAVLIGLVLVAAGFALMVATFVVLAGGAYNLMAARGHGLCVRVGPVPATEEPVVLEAPVRTPADVPNPELSGPAPALVTPMAALPSTLSGDPAA